MKQVKSENDQVPSVDYINIQSEPNTLHAEPLINKESIGKNIKATVVNSDNPDDEENPDTHVKSDVMLEDILQDDEGIPP